MKRWYWGVGLLVPCLALVLATAARADRVPSSKAYYPTDPGSRPQITVPYTTNGGSALGVYQGVAPSIYKSPSLNDPTAPGVKPVFNLIFYGSSQGYGGASNGAAQRPPNELKPPPGK